MAIQHGTAGKSVREMASRRYQKASVPALVILIAGLLMLTNLNRIAKLGLPAVILICVVIKFGSDRIEKQANHLKKRSRDADRGALAEERVSVQLGDLPERYHALHDIAFKGFNIDHVVIGPGGIFLIETKSYRGEVDANGDMLLLNGKPPKKDFLKQTLSQTYRLKEFLWKMTSQEWQVKPVFCFSNAFVKVRRPVKGIEVIRIGYLKRFFARQSSRLSPEQIERLVRPLNFWLQKHSQD
ncbi:MAG: nuclease-related domain-containing protein [Syntrophobacteraceae bacterium]|jgi:hypothetical protein